MRSMFPGYYRPKADEFAEKFKECIFCFDTNVLLNLYRFTPESRESLLKVLQHANIRDRIWLPHRVGFEYQRRRTDVLLGQQGLVGKAESIIENAITELEKLRRTTMFAVNALIDPVRADLEAVKGKLQSKKEAKSDLMEGDPIFDALTDLFDGKVGKPYTADEEKAIHKKGKDRYDAKVPPGYEDGSKDPSDTDQYGDLLFWLQIIEYAKTQDKPIILVTDDAKGDWWRKVSGETLGPRVELIEEFAKETGGRWFYMYSTEMFLKHAKEHLEAPVTPEVIKEAEDIKKHDAQEEKARFNISEALDALERGDPLAVAAAAEAVEQTRRLRSTDYSGIAAAADKMSRLQTGAEAEMERISRMRSEAEVALEKMGRVRDVGGIVAEMDRMSRMRDGAAAAMEKMNRMHDGVAAAMDRVRDIGGITAAIDKIHRMRDMGGIAAAMDKMNRMRDGAMAAVEKIDRMQGIAAAALEKMSRTRDIGGIAAEIDRMNRIRDGAMDTTNLMPHLADSPEAATQKDEEQCEVDETRPSPEGK